MQSDARTAGARALMAILTQKLTEVAAEGDDELDCQVIRALAPSDAEEGRDRIQGKDEQDAVDHARAFADVMQRLLNGALHHRPLSEGPVEAALEHAMESYEVPHALRDQCHAQLMRVLESYA